MAKINRNFLVPYLQDVCALYMADLTVAAMMFGTQKEIIQLRRGKELDPPEEPEKVEAWDGIGCLFASAGIFLMVGPLICLLSLFSYPELAGLVMTLLIICEPLGYAIWRGVGKPSQEGAKINEENQQRYLEAMKRYKEEKKQLEIENEKAREGIPQLEQKMKELSVERKRIAKVLNKVYAANVIPSHYRDMYAAVYLYDFFSTSRSDDLDMALNTYVLEQIKDKLDTIIERQKESILNQRMMLVNQQISMEEQRAHNAYMRKKARQIAASVEEQNQYLAMVESNSAATAYFAAANYLR